MIVTFKYNGKTYSNWNMDNPKVRAELEAEIGPEAVKGIIAGEERQGRIAAIRDALTGTDYKAIKYAEGQLSDAEYADIKAQRQAWREEINALEAEWAKKRGECGGE